MVTVTDSADLRRNSAAGIGFLRRPGNGMPLVLLHGIGSNAGSFAPAMASLPISIDAIAWDAPGYGSSQPLPAAAPTPQDYADVLSRVLDALELRRIVLAGHSLGALFAASFAARHPERVAAVALISPALGYGVAPGAPLPAVVQSRIDEVVELGPRQFAATRAARLVGDPQARLDVVATVQQAMAAVHPAGYIQAVRALGAGDLVADAARLSQPALVAVGTLDRITPPPGARRLHVAMHRDTRYHEIEGAGHALPQELPQTVAGLLAELVARS